MNHEKSQHHHSGHQHGALIEKLIYAAWACENCAASSLDEDDVTKMSHCIEVDRDCADLCNLTAKLLIRDSEFAHKLLALCEQACRHCSEECSKHEHEHCQHCAAVCQECADMLHNHHLQIKL